MDGWMGDDADERKDDQPGREFPRGKMWVREGMGGYDER